MSGEVQLQDGIAYREAVPSDDAGHPPALLVHGFPESSYMWRDVLPAIAASGRRAIAPDLPGYGDSPPDPPGTWEHHIEAVERFCEGLGLERVALVTHDWGGLIGLRWACEHPARVSSLVVSCTGFFPDGKWHGMAEAIRTPGTGEELVTGISRDALAATLGQASTGIGDDAVDEYFKCCADDVRRGCLLDLYRSGDFEKLEPYQGQLAELEVPALILWGAHDEFAPVAGAHRFRRDLPDSRLVVLEEAGHFVIEDDPERCAREIAQFLEQAGD